MAPGSTISRGASVTCSIDDLNRMPAGKFAVALGDVAEYSPWVAARAAAARPFADRDAVIDAFTGALRDASGDERRAVLRAHPDLAGRAAIAGELSDDSEREQAGAGLDRLTPEEFERFTALNAAYRARFGIPFIFAVKGSNSDPATSSMIRVRRATDVASPEATLKTSPLVGDARQCIIASTTSST